VRLLCASPRLSGLEDPLHLVDLKPRTSKARSPGSLIINADDWGKDRQNTDRIHECVLHRTVSSVSAMVFMEDSERAASIARENGMDVGLHLNLTAPFTGSGVPAQLNEDHSRIVRYLRGNWLAQAIYHPGLANSFEYVVAKQVEEFRRIYGAAPERIDGHHHMHLCANVVLGRLLPAWTITRRNFSYKRGEGSLLKRWYRGAIDRILAKRHRLTDFFYALQPLRPENRLKDIFSLAREFAVEVETHPINEDEFRFLTDGKIQAQAGECPIAQRYDIPLAKQNDEGRD
jgi:hypothetical protein